MVWLKTYELGFDILVAITTRVRGEREEKSFREAK